MMKFQFICLIALFLTHLTAQTPDSVAIKQVDSLIKVSNELKAKREFDKALEVIAAAEKIAMETLGRESAAYGNCCLNKGEVLHFKGHRAEAEKWYLNSKDILEKALGKNHPDYAWILHNIASLYAQFGNYEKAEPLFLESKAIREKVLGKEHPDYTKSLNNLALVYKLIGQYEKAEPLFLESKAIREKVLGKEHPDYASSLNNLANHYVKMGNYEKANSLYLEAKLIREKVLGKEHPDYSSSLLCLGSLYQNAGNYEKAEPLLLEALAILEKVLGKEHPVYASGLNNLAALYNQMYNYENAKPLFLEAKTIREKVLGKNHPDYAKSLYNLASLYGNMGNWEKAEPLFLESKAIREKVLGKEHPDYASSLNSIANLNERQSRFSDSESFLEEMYALDQARLSRSISFLSERELSSYKATFEDQTDMLGSYLFTRLTPRAIGTGVMQLGILPALAYDNALFYKGFLLTASAQLNTIAEGTPESIEINLRLKTYRRRLATEYTKPIADRMNVAELEENANIAEKELARSIAAYAEAKRQVKWEEVMATLKNDEVAIEFVSFKVNFPQMTDSMMYAALLLKPGTKQLIFIPLFEEKQLDSLLKTSGERKADYVNGLYTLADRGAMAIEVPKKSLYELIWKPMEEELAGVKKIYFSPTGLLHRINLDAIPVSQMETLADKYQLIEVNSTRQLVIPNQKNIANQDAVLIGGIQYEQDSAIQYNEPILVSRSRGELSFSSVDSTLRGGSWNSLAWTEWEVNSIEKIMQTAGFAVALKKGNAATEESFKNIGTNNSPSPRILHVATHGYFFPDVKQKNKETIINSQSEPVFKISDHPMLRSGLIMAGGNAAWKGVPTLEGREDGILTAYEISQMNLSNTELVVLSACETGLGDIQGNEGVYGLQRAFKIAGAKYLIMSLWQVPDKQTSLLMTTFYKKWLEEKMTIPDAFHAAQKVLRDNGLDPYHWAGFVLVE